MPEELAPDGQVWVCQGCGNFNVDRGKVGDIDCYINTMLMDRKLLIVNEEGLAIGTMEPEPEEMNGSDPDEDLETLEGDNSRIA